MTDAIGYSTDTKGDKSPSILVIDAVLVLLGLVFTIAGIIALLHLIQARDDSAEVRDRYEECTAAATDLMEASDHLTTQARMHVVTGDVTYLQAYMDELLHARRRDHAVATLRRNAEGTDAERELSEALDYSNALAERELYAMRLVADAVGATELPDRVATVELSEEDAALDSDKKRELAEQMILGTEYGDLKTLIIKDVDQCATSLSDDIIAERAASLANERRMQSVLLASLLLDATLLIIAGISNYLLIMRPMQRIEQQIERNEPLQVEGSRELRKVAKSYNRIYAENMRRTVLLQHQAHTDGLTGLLNRGSFDRLLSHHGEDVALMIVDVDEFKQINDEFGHEVGDDVLRKVGTLLKGRFRNTDYVCRIGGDEFAVLLTEMRCEMRGVVSSKIEGLFNDLMETSDGLPVTTLSIGIAFSVTLPDGVSLYHAADGALYEAKHLGRNRYVYYEED